VAKDLLRRGFVIVEKNKWFGRRFEVDIWASRNDIGDVWIEVKTLSDPEWCLSRVRNQQLTRLRRASISLEATLWLALVCPQKNIEYVDLHTMEPVEC